MIPCDLHSPSTAFLRWRASRAGATLDVIEPHELSVIADAVWIIDTLDHITDLDQQLGPLLRTARLVICEHLAAGRAHGRQRFHHRRTPEQITGIFSRYGFARAEQPAKPEVRPSQYGETSERLCCRTRRTESSKDWDDRAQQRSGCGRDWAHWH